MAALLNNLFDRFMCLLTLAEVHSLHPRVDLRGGLPGGRASRASRGALQTLSSFGSVASSAGVAAAAPAALTRAVLLGAASGAARARPVAAGGDGQVLRGADRVRRRRLWRGGKFAGGGGGGLRRGGRRGGGLVEAPLNGGPGRGVAARAARSAY